MKNPTQETPAAVGGEPQSEEHLQQNDVLLYIPDKEQFFKIQPGTGDNLSNEDIADGYVDCFLWSNFDIGYLGLDSEFDVDCLDSGMVLTEEAFAPTEDYIYNCLEDCYGEVPKYIQLLSRPD